MRFLTPTNILKYSHKHLESVSGALRVTKIQMKYIVFFFYLPAFPVSECNITDTPCYAKMKCTFCLFFCRLCLRNSDISWLSKYFSADLDHSNVQYVGEAYLTLTGCLRYVLNHFTQQIKSYFSFISVRFADVISNTN